MLDRVLADSVGSDRVHGSILGYGGMGRLTVSRPGRRDIDEVAGLSLDRRFHQMERSQNVHFGLEDPFSHSAAKIHLSRGGIYHLRTETPEDLLHKLTVAKIPP